VLRSNPPPQSGGGGPREAWWRELLRCGVITAVPNCRRNSAEKASQSRRPLSAPRTSPLLRFARPLPGGARLGARHSLPRPSGERPAALAAREGSSQSGSAAAGEGDRANGSGPMTSSAWWRGLLRCRTITERVVVLDRPDRGYRFQARKQNPAQNDGTLAPVSR